MWNSKKLKVERRADFLNEYTAPLCSQAKASSFLIPMHSIIFQVKVRTFHAYNYLSIDRKGSDWNR